MMNPKAGLPPAFFGVVEGFYGPPWTCAQRSSVIRFLGDVGLDTYLYAPKNEPAHRGRFAEPLSRSALSDLESLLAVASAAKVRFVYGISPERLIGGSNLRFRSQSDTKHPLFVALVDKLVGLVERGIETLAVLFDDTWATLVPWSASFKTGAAHANLVHALAQTVFGRTGFQPDFLVVPAAYFGRAADLGRGAKAYLRGLASQGPLLAAWTGPRIFSAFISGAETRALQTETGLAPWIWSNSIANDWLPLATGEPVGVTPRQRLCFGPVDNLASDLIPAARGILLNGAREPELTKVSLHTLASFAKDPLHYDPIVATQKAIAALFDTAAHADIARLLRFVDPRNTDFPTRADLQSLAEVDTRLAQSLESSPCLDELRPTAAKLALGARALLADLDRDSDARAKAATCLRIPWDTRLYPHLRAVARSRNRKTR